MENNIELQEMREQLVSFKQQLAGQKIINDRLMRKATAEKVSRLRRKKNWTIVFGVIAILSLQIFYSYDFPVYFIAYATAMIVFSVVMTIIYHSNVDKADFLNGDLRNAAIELKKLRTRYIQWYWIAVPMVVIFLALFFYSCMHSSIPHEFVKSFMTGGIVGGIVGAIIGILSNRNVVRLCNEIIRDLESN